MNQNPEVQDEPAGKSSGEDRLAQHGFFLNEDLQGTTEGEQVAIQLADIFKSMQEGPPSDPVESHPAPLSNLSTLQKSQPTHLHPMSKNSVTVIYKKNKSLFTDEQMELIRLGTLPEVKNDEWIMVYVERARKLCIHHSVSGICLYEVKFQPGPMGWEVGKIKFSCSDDGKGSFEDHSAETEPMTLINHYLLSPRHRGI